MRSGLATRPVGWEVGRVEAVGDQVLGPVRCSMWVQDGSPNISVLAQSQQSKNMMR